MLINHNSENSGTAYAKRIAIPKLDETSQIHSKDQLTRQLLKEQ